MKKSPYQCPQCGGSGQWRRGVGFEHEKICMKCSKVWDPEERIQNSPKTEMKQSIEKTTVGTLLQALEAIGCDPETSVTVNGDAGIRIDHSEDAQFGIVFVSLTGDNNAKDNYLKSVDHTLRIEEGQRQTMLLALAHLAVERPGWDYMLKGIAAKMDNEGCPMYEEFKQLHSERVIDIGGQDA